MTTADTDTIKALKQVLDLTDEDDWHLVHLTVRKYVAGGRISAETEQAYKAMVDKMRGERLVEKQDD